MNARGANYRVCVYNLWFKSVYRVQIAPCAPSSVQTPLRMRQVGCQTILGDVYILPDGISGCDIHTRVG